MELLLGPGGGKFCWETAGAATAVDALWFELSFAAAIYAGVGSGMNFHVSLVYFFGGKDPVC